MIDRIAGRAAALVIAAIASTAVAAPADRADKVGRPTPPPVVEESGACSPGTTSYKTSRGPISTSSQSFRSVDDTFLRFRQGGSQNSCVLVYFTAEASAPGDVMEIRAVLDATSVPVVASPADVYFARDTELEARGFNFVFPRVSPGLHNVRIQIRSLGGSPVTLYYRSLIIEYE